jgi:SAM-dependent methyltransferase
MTGCEAAPAARERERLRATFESVAELYHRVRPDYPQELYDELMAAAGLRAGDAALEVGCATGKATLPLARRGLAITCLELGAGLAAAARRNLAGFPRVAVINADFEGWSPPSGHPGFDLVCAATSWHWIDPAARYRRARELLRPGGHLAIWAASHVFPDGGDPFFRDIQDVYDEIGESMTELSYPRPGELPDLRADIEASGLFTDVVVRHFDWQVSYDADEYTGLLDTFSGHIAMQPWQRRRLYGEIRSRLRQRADGRVRRGWGAVLSVARRRDDPAPRG